MSTEELGPTGLQPEQAARSVARSTLVYSVGAAVEKGIYVLGLGIFTRLLAPTEFGTVALFTTWSAIFTIVLSINAFPAVKRNVHDRSPDDLGHDVVGAATVTLSITGAVAIVVAVLPSDLVESVFSLRKELLLLAIVATVFEAPVRLVRVVRVERRDARYELAVAMAIAVGNVGLSVACIELLGPNGTGLFAPDTARIAGIVVTQALVLLAVAPANLDLLFAGFRRSAIAPLLVVSAPLVLHALGTLGLTQSDRIVIDHILGRDATGVYSAGYQIGLLAQIVVVAVNRGWSPWFMPAMSRKALGEIRRAGTRLAIAVAGVCAAATIGAPTATAILAPSDYDDARAVATVVVSSTFWLFAYGQLSTQLLFRRRSGATATATLVALAVNVAANIPLVSIHGVVAAAWTTTASYAILFAANWWALRNDDEARVALPMATFVSLGLALTALAGVTTLFV